MDSGRLLLLGWRIAPRIPAVVLRAVGYVAAHVVWLLRGKGVRQLEQNLARVVPRRQIRSTSRRAMLSYLNYWVEALLLTGATEEQIAARVRCDHVEYARKAVAEDGSAILVLGHQGNYDLAGAWASRHIAPLITVAERLKPDELFTEFRTFRERLGMTIYAHTGEDAFRNLLRHAKAGNSLIALLADRDLTTSGIEVEMFDETASVAAGPVALARAAGIRIIPTTIHYERLRGERRRRAKWPWGIVLHFGEPYGVSKQGKTTDLFAAGSQRWASNLAESIRARPQDWHMMQKVFVADLDPDRYRKKA